MPKTDLFLPFTSSGKKIERTAIDLKDALGLGPYEVVDPFEVLPRVPARVAPHAALAAMPSETRQLLLDKGGSSWSAIGVGQSPQDGSEIILLNPNHHPHRQRVSLMEEIVHILQNHPRVRLDFDGSGSWERPYDSASEDEAFGVGAACIIPYRVLFNRINRRSQPAAKIASDFDVSVEYVRYRIKRAGLYNVYRARQRTRRSRK